jgi:hypothetical protein
MSTKNKNRQGAASALAAGPRQVSLNHHKAHCAICSHSDRADIEEDFLHWRSPGDIAEEHQLGAANRLPTRSRDRPLAAPPPQPPGSFGKLDRRRRHRGSHWRHRDPRGYRSRSNQRRGQRRPDTSHHRHSQAPGTRKNISTHRARNKGPKSLKTKDAGSNIATQNRDSLNSRFQSPEAPASGFARVETGLARLAVEGDCHADYGAIRAGSYFELGAELVDSLAHP